MKQVAKLKRTYKLAPIFDKVIALAYVYQLAKFGVLMSCGSKYISKNAPLSCTNTDHDVTDLVNHRMFKNTKTSISWERNITFLRNKKILKGFLRYKTINSQNVLSEVQKKNFFNFIEKLCSVLDIFKFLCF